MADQFSNFATSSIAGGTSGVGTSLLSTDTTLRLQAGDGAKFPSSGPFRIVLGLSSVTPEVCVCTSRSGDNLTIVRGQEGTTAITWGINTIVQHNITAGNLQNLWAAANDQSFINAQLRGNTVLSPVQTLVAAPTTNPMTFSFGFGGGMPTGFFIYAFSYVDVSGVESALSPTASFVLSGGENQVFISNIPTGPSGIVARNIYRSKTGGGELYYDGKIANNTATTYNDSIADGSLQIASPDAGGVTQTVYDQTGTVSTKITPFGFFTYRETGVCGRSDNGCTAGDTVRVMVQFRAQQLNAPTSVTLTTTSSTNANTPSVSNITVYGFLLSWTVPANGASTWYGTYQTNP